MSHPLEAVAAPPTMLAMLRDLVDHKNHANASLVKAIGDHEQACGDPNLRQLLHHIILANRFWLALFAGKPFDIEAESRTPETLQAIAALYRDTCEQETQWLAGLRDCDLERPITTPFLPGRSFTLAQATLQVCLHSHGHRSQCATKLRTMGGEPPPTDFIAWLKDRPAPDWESIALHLA